MLIKNTDTRFGVMSILLHWSMALLMITVLCMGLYMTRIPLSIMKLTLFRWHKEWGMLILCFAIFRLFWRLNTLSPSLAQLSLWERSAARSVHFIFYLLMFLLPLSGWLLSSSAGIPVSFFGVMVFPDLIAANENKRIVLTNVHAWLSYALIFILSLHILAALKHHLIEKDDILRRMLWPS